MVIMIVIKVKMKTIVKTWHALDYWSVVGRTDVSASKRYVMDFLIAFYLVMTR